VNENIKNNIEQILLSNISLEPTMKMPQRCLVLKIAFKILEHTKKKL
jgi:hypothetical protein